MVPISQTIIQAATFSADGFLKFDPNCKGPFATQKFFVPFPTPFPPGTNVRVILTANDLFVDSGDHNVALVGVARNVSNTGFELYVSNSDCSPGFAGINYIAIAETPGQTHFAPLIRMRLLQPFRQDGLTAEVTDEYFGPDCKGPADTLVQTVKFWSPLGTRANPPVVVLTATNTHVKPFISFGARALDYHNAAAVGIVQTNLPSLLPPTHGFNLRARSSDCGFGGCAFYYLALSRDPNEPGDRTLFVDTGEVSASDWPQGGRGLDFGPNCDRQGADTKRLTVDFAQPFLTPPVVLLTANDRGIDPTVANVALVGMAQDVTPWGFTLQARNSDCSVGQAGFFWVAVGCALGCG